MTSRWPDKDSCRRSQDFSLDLKRWSGFRKVKGNMYSIPDRKTSEQRARKWQQRNHFLQVKYIGLCE